MKEREKKCKDKSKLDPEIKRKVRGKLGLDGNAKNLGDTQESWRDDLTELRKSRTQGDVDLNLLKAYKKQDPIEVESFQRSASAQTGDSVADESDKIILHYVNRLKMIYKLLTCLCEG